MKQVKDPSNILFLIFIMSKLKTVLKIWINNQISSFLDTYFMSLKHRFRDLKKKKNLVLSSGPNAPLRSFDYTME